jgi:hypothetical protein
MVWLIGVVGRTMAAIDDEVMVETEVKEVDRVKGKGELENVPFYNT